MFLQASVLVNAGFVVLPVLAGGQAIVWLSWPFGRSGMAVAFMLTALACMAWRFTGGVTARTQRHDSPG